MCTLAGNASAAVELALHESGHSFADLADEYDYDDATVYTGPEPGDPNVSILDASTQIAQQAKWYRWMDLPYVDTFEGAYYSQYGIYRPTYNSKMRSLDRPFQEINIEQFILSIYRAVSPIDDATPTSAEPLSGCTAFFVTAMEPLDHALDIQWSVDWEPVPFATGSTFEPDVMLLTPGSHYVMVTVTDNTPEVRDEGARQQLMTESRLWEITVTGEPDECGGTVPTVSEWGLIALTLLAMTLATIMLARQRPVSRYTRSQSRVS